MAKPNQNPYITILGTLQDGGSPHIGCLKSCCNNLFAHPDPHRKVVSLGLTDPQSQKDFLFEATPDIPTQLHFLKNAGTFQRGNLPDAIFLTHAHIGHYSGLMYLGKEALNTKNTPVYVMPGMKSFLLNNEPWRGLVSNGNIELWEMNDNVEIQLSPQLKVSPFLVPHRQEFSETVGFRITGPERSALFIPDIDKWELWDKDIRNEIERADYAFLDATFYDDKEVPGRNISKIPHPFVKESLALFRNLDSVERNKVFFVHLNHSNPLLNDDSEETKAVLDNGFRIAKFKDVFYL